MNVISFCINYNEDKSFNTLVTFDGVIERYFTSSNIADAGFLFNKNVTLVSFDDYRHFEDLFKEFKKYNLDYDIEQCYATSCLTDMCRLLRRPVADKSLQNAREVYFKLMRLPIVCDNIVLNSNHKLWITYGGDRIQTETSGKWIIYGNKLHLAAIWHKIVKSQNMLKYCQARVSTSGVNIWGGKRKVGVIELFYISSNYMVLQNIGKDIVNLCRPQLEKADTTEIRYKTDKQTKRGKGKYLMRVYI